MYSPHGRSYLEILREEGGLKPQISKEGIKLMWNASGGRFKPKNFPWGGYGYFLEKHNV